MTTQRVLRRTAGRAPVPAATWPEEVLPSLPVVLDDAVSALLHRPGRSEGMAFSPSGTTVAIIGAFGRIVFARVAVRRDGSGAVASVSLADPVDTTIPGWRETHGVAFLDEQLVAIADREQGLGLFRVPAGRAAVPGQPLALESLLQVTDASPVGGTCQSAVAVGPVLPGRGGRRDLFGCDSERHEVVRHLVALDGGASGSAATTTARVLDAELLADAGALPDGLALSPDGRWLAVTLHDAGRVAIVRLGEAGAAGAADGPRVVGSVVMLEYLHGVAFADGGRVLLATDAGSPVIGVACAPDGDWSGERTGVVIRVMDEATHRLAATNPLDGGPKGIACHEGLGIVAVTSAAQRFAAFPVEQLLAAAGARAHVAAALPVPQAGPSDPADEHIARLERRLGALAGAQVAHRAQWGPGSRRQERAVRLVLAVERSALWRALVWLRYGGRVRRARRDLHDLEVEIATRVGAGPIDRR